MHVTRGEGHSPGPMLGDPFLPHPTSLSPEPQHLTPAHPEARPQGNLLCQSEMATAKRTKPQLTCKAHKDGRERKPERQKLSLIISVSKVLPKTEIKLRAPVSKPKSQFLGLDKSWQLTANMSTTENQAATKLLDPHGRSNVMNNYTDSKKGIKHLIHSRVSHYLLRLHNYNFMMLWIYSTIKIFWTSWLNTQLVQQNCVARVWT